MGTGSRPLLVGDPRASIPQREFPDVRGPVIFNPAAFALPTGLTFGNVGRNTLNYPGRLNFDAGLSKRFAISERAGFDFKWEVFNMFNHTQFSTFDSTARFDATGAQINGQFGQYTAARDPRLIQLSMRLQF